MSGWAIHIKPPIQGAPDTLSLSDSGAHVNRSEQKSEKSSRKSSKMQYIVPCESLNYQVL